MFHVKQLWIAGLLLISLQAAGQKSPSPETETTDHTHLLSGEESAVLQVINLMRSDPKNFYKTYLAAYIQSNSRFTTYYTRSLKEDMEQAGPLQPLSPSPVMQKTAAFQAKDLLQYKGKRLDHTSSDGTTFEARMQQAGVGCAGENIYTGQNRSAIQMIMDLLIDQGVASFGHRKTLLSKNYKSIGISVQSYSAEGKIMVQDFSCQ